MTRLATSFVLGYHGCAHEVAEKAIAGSLKLLKSERDYDWLGPGIYFWEADPERAREWAEDRVRQGKIGKAAVIGAVIDLGNCLDFSVRTDIQMLARAYQSLVATINIDGSPMPENRDLPSGVPGNGLLRYLDCAVIRRLHQMVKSEDKLSPFDSVRGLFPEGGPAYPGAGFTKLSHRQIAVVSPENCIKGLFWAR